MSVIHYATRRQDCKYRQQNWFTVQKVQKQSKHNEKVKAIGYKCIQPPLRLFNKSVHLFEERERESMRTINTLKAKKKWRCCTFASLLYTASLSPKAMLHNLLGKSRKTFRSFAFSVGVFPRSSRALRTIYRK